jgi:hypothetical protein
MLPLFLGEASFAQSGADLNACSTSRQAGTAYSGGLPPHSTRRRSGTLCKRRSPGVRRGRLRPYKSTVCLHARGALSSGNAYQLGRKRILGE